MGWSPKGFEFKRAYLYDVNPVGVGAMGLASLISVMAYVGWLGELAQAFSAVIAMVVAALVAIVMEVTRIVTKGRFKLSSVAIGLGVVLPPESVFAMFVGALMFWVMSLRHKKTPGTLGHRIWVECCEPICAGLISGAALMGIGNAILNVLI